jgi:hypothetical protein
MIIPGPLSGDPELDNDMIEDHQRRLLEEVEADQIAEGESEVQEGSYKPVTDSDDTPDDNRFIKE